MSASIPPGLELSICANLYGYGRLAWNPNLSAQQIANEWTRLTFGNNPTWRIWWSGFKRRHGRCTRTTPARWALQTLTDITGNHYGVNVEASERNGWGQWHRADAKGVGMDRTVATGTGYTGQYSHEVAAHLRESRKHARRHRALLPPRAVHVRSALRQNRDPDYLRHALRGARSRRRLRARVERRLDGAGSTRSGATPFWRSSNIRPAQAEVWQDAICNWFFKTSGIPDAQRRVGNLPAASKLHE